MKSDAARELRAIRATALLVRWSGGAAQDGTRGALAAWLRNLSPDGAEAIARELSRWRRKPATLVALSPHRTGQSGVLSLSTRCRGLRDERTKLPRLVLNLRSERVHSQSEASNR
jgi:hypothetical protein